MKTIVVGSTTLTATKCERLRDLKKGFYLDVTIQLTELTPDEIYALFNGTTEDIVVTDETGAVVTYKGFKQTMGFSRDDTTCSFAQVCTSELEAQLSLAQSKIAEQANTITVLKNEAVAQANEVLAQAQVIVAQGETIATQNDQIAELVSMSTSQLAAMDTIMLEVLPMVAQEAATIAVEQALAAMEETEETTEEN